MVKPSEDRSLQTFWIAPSWPTWVSDPAIPITLTNKLGFWALFHISSTSTGWVSCTPSLIAHYSFCLYFNVFVIIRTYIFIYIKCIILYCCIASHFFLLFPLSYNILRYTYITFISKLCLMQIPHMTCPFC